MKSFLNPVQEIFQFFEDSMAVSVGFAMGAQKFKDLNALLHVSVIGGFVCGFAALCLMGSLAMSDSIAGPMLNPSFRHNEALISAGCDLIPGTEQLLSHARIYWILQTAAWMPFFVNKGVLGFLLGAGDFAGMAIPMIVQTTVPISLWFYLSANTAMNELIILGVANGLAPWITTVSILLYLLRNKKLTSQYHLHRLPLCTREGQRRSCPRFIAVGKKAIGEGLQLMVVDVAIQISITLTMYITAAMGFEAAYKIAAAQAAYVILGPSYVIGFVTYLKTQGASALARGQHARLSYSIAFFTLIMIFLSISAVIGAQVKGKQLALTFSETACVYASKRECSSVYVNIFKGTDNAEDVFSLLGPVTAIQIMFAFSRAFIMIFQDYAFMARAAVASLVVVYVPAIIISTTVLRSSSALFVTMYIPHVALLLVFGTRTYVNLKKVIAGVPGPWVTRRESMSLYDGNEDDNDDTSDDEDDDGMLLNAYQMDGYGSVNQKA